MLAATNTAPFAQEIHALKTELQATLVRLSAAQPQTQSSWRERPAASPWSGVTNITTTTTTTTPTSPRTPSTTATATPSSVHSRATTERSSPSPQADPSSRILRELVATARRRRQAETQLVRELERDSARVQQDFNPVRTRHTAQETARRSSSRDRKDDGDDTRDRAIHREINALRLRRKQILHQIDNESKMDHAPLPVLEHAHRMEERKAEMEAASKDNQEYSIQGIVKLARMQSRTQPVQEPMQSVSAPETSIHHQPTSQSAYDYSFPRQFPFGGHQHHRHHQEVIQDVFSIQLKFAETMLQLEKSIQVRDRLLVPTSSSSSTSYSSPRPGRTGSSRRQQPAPRRRRSRGRQPATVYEDRDLGGSSAGDEDSDDANGLQIQSYSSDDASMSEHTTRLWRRYRLDRPQNTPASAAASTPSTGASTAPESQPSPASTGPDTHVMTTPIASSSSPPSPRAQQGQLQSLIDDEQLHTPSTNESTKQVRFHHHHDNHSDEYSTPVIARNISFDQDSIDSTTDDEQQQPLRRRMQHLTQKMELSKQPPAPRVAADTGDDDEELSFMAEDASICSADLQDESFLAAFAALRRELRGETNAYRGPQHQQFQSATATETKPKTEPIQVSESVVVLDAATLRQRKRALTLDIQELTAKLVLAQDATARDQASKSLDRLRRQLREVESHS